ncbi:MAG: class I SAM-dependent methyltransferase [Planctomycetes bacterium]|nr:class I SAM-dependent methyltransferase [Planctomycetota bacterium]
MPDSFSNVKAVFEQQSMYDAVVQADYMQHTELVATLADWARTQTVPLRIIDLGCGDAWLATHAFRDANVEMYRGVDVSDSSGERARHNTAIWPGRTEVATGNLADFLHKTPDASANVVLASYSVHHLSSEAKIALIADCRRVLVPGGTFFWIDPVRNDNESRDDYINRLTHVMQNDWTALTLDDREKACTHVRTSDFPETGRWMFDQVQRAGFQRTATLLHNDFFDGWAFTKK